MAAITQWDMSKKKRELLEEVIMINPEVISKGEKTEIEEEGCLSLPGITGDVSRPTQITIKYQTIDGKQHIRKISGYNARIVQHEIDHLDGVLFIDKLA
jgi:peptide deformylase